MSARRVAAIDVGTNTVLLLVAEAGADGAPVPVLERCITARLGQGLATTGRLADEALERGLRAVADHLAQAEALGVPRARTRVVGTAVLRRARDAERFLAAARERLGFDVVVLSEEDEARLGYEAVCGGAAPGTFLVDVGGGSTEIAGRTRPGDALLRRSVPIGAVVLTERYLGPASGGGWTALDAAVAQAMRAFPAGLCAGADLRAIGGSAVHLASLDAGGATFDVGVAEGRVVETALCRAWAERLAALDVESRCAFPIERERAAILPAGLACLAAAAERLEAPRLRVHTGGVRYGVARELLTEE